MAKHLRQIDADALRIGMYVAQLDRPWLETPFLFQGFYIRSETEIEDIKRYCSYVEIDLDESSPAIRQILAATPTPVADSSKSRRRGLGALWRWLRALFSKPPEAPTAQPAPGEFYKDTVSTADELVVAKTTHSGALQQIMSTLEAVRAGKEISMPDLEVVTGAMVDSVLRNSTAMSLLARMQEKDDYTSSHAMACSIWALVFGRHLGLDRDALAAVGLGGLLLDVGKTKLPEALLKKTGKLTDEERALINSHVGHGLDIIRKAPGLDRRVIDMVATHHERFDGSGYPRGWQGNKIPIFGRIGGIVDSYAAMTSDQPYSPAKSSYDAMREFKALSDKHFQAEMVEQFIQAIGIFPPGTLVELNTGEIGVVLREHKTARLQPELAIILDSKKQPKPDLEIIDLLEQGSPTPTVWIERGVQPGVYDVDPKKYFL